MPWAALPDHAHRRHGTTSRDWMNRAACRSDPPTPDNIRDRAEMFFFPGKKYGRGAKETRRRQNEVAAKQICSECPVTAECETYRADLDINYGVWGGITESERPHGGWD